MLAHNVDGDHPASYSDLLLAAQKLERWAEAGVNLLPKTTTTRGLNITSSQNPENVFPSQKLKGNCAFTTQSATVKRSKAEDDSYMKPEGEEEAKSSVEEDAEPKVELEEWISQLGILSILPTWLSCIRGKVKIVSDAVVLTIS